MCVNSCDSVMLPFHRNGKWSKKIVRVALSFRFHALNQTGSCGPMDDGYVHSYESVETHRLMVQDRARVQAYKRALEAIVEQIRGGVVLDVGAGTGLFACLAARLGAKKVYAIEPSGIAEYAQRVIEHNGYANTISVVQKRVEDITEDDGVSECDVLVSEWMGFHLLHECMLPSVLKARNRFLKTGGSILPQHARLWCCPVSMDKWADTHLHFWEDVCGLDMSAMVEPAVQAALTSPQIVDVAPEQLLAQPLCAKSIDLYTCTPSEAQIADTYLPFEAVTEGYCHGFCLWFDVSFALPSKASESSIPSDAITLSTSPHAEQTHWKQSVVLISSVLRASPGSSLACRLQIRPDELQPRHAVISVEVRTAIQRLFVSLQIM